MTHVTLWEMFSGILAWFAEAAIAPGLVHQMLT
jgi:hypothetical protein